MIRINDLPRESRLSILEQCTWQNNGEFMRYCVAQNCPIDEMVVLDHTLEGYEYWEYISARWEAIRALELVYS